MDNPAALRRIGRMGKAALLGCAVALGASASLLLAAPKNAAPEKPGDFEQALQVIAQAREAYQAVQDYACTFVKSEVIGGKLQPENAMAMKVKAQPFSVHFKWQTPKALEGQECCYVTGKHNGVLRGKSPGVLGIVGFVNISLTDPQVVNSSRYPITDAGIGNLIDRLAKRWPEEKARQRTVATVRNYEFSGKRCTRVETVNPNTQPGEFFCYRSVIYFDQESKLPIRAEMYDWPKPGSPPGGAFLESYNYVNLKLNVGLTDKDFAY